jgi:hypothetical protein
VKKYQIILRSRVETGKFAGSTANTLRNCPQIRGDPQRRFRKNFPTYAGGLKKWVSYGRTGTFFENIYCAR